MNPVLSVEKPEQVYVALAAAFDQDKITSLTGDVLIAAVANELGATLLPEKIDDFEFSDGGSVETD